MVKNAENLNLQNEGLPLITTEDFKTEVLGYQRPVLVEFWTPWSRPCQILESTLQEMVRELEGNIRVVKVNADHSIDLSLCYDIQSLPTLICFVEGVPLWNIVGTASKKAILKKLKSFSRPTTEANQTEIPR